MIARDDLRARADLAGLRGDRETCLRLYGLLWRIEAIEDALTRINARLDALGAPRCAGAHEFGRTSHDAYGTC